MRGYSKHSNVAVFPLIALIQMWKEGRKTLVIVFFHNPATIKYSCFAFVCCYVRISVCVHKIDIALYANRVVNIHY